MPDQRQRFLFEDFAIRGELANLESSVQGVFNNHEYPSPIKKLIGEFMVASALLSATIKFDGSLILQVKGSEQVSLLMAECRNQRDLRAFAQYSDNFDTNAPLLGDGQMSITIEPTKGERYQGIVLIKEHGLAHAIEQYFLQSEQLRTRIWLSASESQAAGLLLQSLPESASESSLNLASEDWDRVSMLADTITERELLVLEQMEVLRRLFHEETLRAFTPSSLQFECSCSEERSANALISLGETEVRTLFAERKKPIEIDCQFCHAKYLFDERAINKIFGTQIH